MSCNGKTFRDAILPAMDVIRGLPGVLGQRLFTVQVVTREWTGTRSGLGSNTDVGNTIRVDLGQFQCKVKQVSERDAIASGGLYSNQDLEIGPITPPYNNDDCGVTSPPYNGSAANNSDITVFDPLPGAAPKEVFFNVKGPGHPAAGSWYKKVSQDVTMPFHYTFIVQRTAEIP